MQKGIHRSSSGLPEQTSAAIYTLANDKTLDWLFGLVGSLKDVGCELPIYVIPFNKQTAALRKSVRRWHGVQLWEPPELEELDEIGLKICQTERQYSRSVFRKLATFWSAHDIFIYLDSDIVLGGNPEQWVARYRHVWTNVDIVAMDDDWKWVFRAGCLSKVFEQNKRPAVNTGFWLGRRGLVSFEDVRRVASSARRYRDEMIEGEQSFWNYLMWKNDLVVRTFPCLGSEFVNWAWATHSIGSRENRGFVQRKSSNSPESGPTFIIPFLHWAGFELGPQMVNWDLYLKAALRAAGWSGSLALLYRFCRVNPRAFLYNGLHCLIVKLNRVWQRLTASPGSVDA